MRYNAIINIASLTGHIAASEADGQLVFQEILTRIRGMAVTLDFAGVDVITPTFLNVAIGQLYGRYTEQFIKKRMTVQGLENDLTLLKKVVDNAKEYFRGENMARMQLGDKIKKAIQKVLPEYTTLTQEYMASADVNRTIETNVEIVKIETKIRQMVHGTDFIAEFCRNGKEEPIRLFYRGVPIAI